VLPLVLVVLLVLPLLLVLWHSLQPAALELAVLVLIF